jgi:ankyrin repeat protein
MTHHRDYRRPGQPVRLDRRTVLGLLGAVGAAAATSTTMAQGGASRPSPFVAEAFLRAVRAGDLAAVNAMLDEDASLARQKDRQGRSAYVLARLGGHRDIAGILLERGIELDIVEALLAGDWDRVNALAADNPAIMNQAHPIGGNTLYAAAIGGGERLFQLRALGADPNGRPAGGSGLTPARAAMSCVDARDAWLGAIDLLGNGADVNAPQAGGDSVLHGAVRARDARLVRLAIRKGADPTARDIAGRTPADLAVELEWEEGREILSRHEEIPRDYRASRFAFTADREPFELPSIDDIPRELQHETTTLSHFDQERIREMLADEPRLVFSISADDEMAIEACGHTGRRDIVRMHLDRGAPLSLPTAISLGDLDHARWLLERDPDLVRERGPHDIPLMWYPAIGGDSVEALELLLRYGADIAQESAGQTVLHQAASLNRPALTTRLLELGADPEAVGYRQSAEALTPVESAVQSQSEDALAAFRDFGIDV